MSASTATTHDLRALPKAHLHVHMEAIARPATVRELASLLGVVAPPMPYRGGFDGFAEAFLAMIAVLSAPGALERVLLEAAEDAAADGVVAVELAVSPRFYADALGGAEPALRRMLDAAAAAREATGVEVSLMVTVDRTLDLDAAMADVDLAIRYRGAGVVSVGLANVETGHPAAPLAPAFRAARAGGLIVAPHAGELVGAESVAEAVDLLGADRVQHGVRVVEDPALLERIARKGVCLDVCPTSNHLLGVIADPTAHPLPRLLDAGVPCTINADDPTFFGVGVLDEYEHCRAVLRLTDAQLAACARTSIEHSALEPEARIAALTGIDHWLDRA
jgi:adenosine deaminase